MAPLGRALDFIQLLSSTAEGVTLDELSLVLGCDRRTVMRIRDVVNARYEVERFVAHDGSVRFRLRDPLALHLLEPTASELAALELERDSRRREGVAQGEMLASLAGKIKARLDASRRRKIEPDLDALARLQRGRVLPGPAQDVDPNAFACIVNAILCGLALDFDYDRDDDDDLKWRRVTVLGVIHGAPSYLIGQILGRDYGPTTFRLDRLHNARLSDVVAAPPEDWDLDEFMGSSFGIWQEQQYEVVLAVSRYAAERARTWRFHPKQEVVSRRGGGVTVKFQSGGLREIADHLFTWGGEVRIEAPEELRDEMRARLRSARRALRPVLSQRRGKVQP